MDEFKEIPLETDDDNSNHNEPEELDEQEIQRRSRKITSEIYKRLGIIILILAGLALGFTILTYVFDDAWADKTILLIEQIIGYVLISISTIVGITFLIQAKKLPSKDELILEPIDSINTIEESEAE